MIYRMATLEDYFMLAHLRWQFRLEENEIPHTNIEVGQKLKV